MAISCVVVLDFAETRHRMQPARWYAPGLLGKAPGMLADVGAAVTGNREAAAGERAPSAGFLTRAFSGLRGAGNVEWGSRNGLTPALSFSHNLTRVFPRELHTTHPEYFPLVDGKRLDPPRGSYFWNPDIARPDVAEHAAAAAREHFAAHPHDVSFALGVNDALIWGDSPELVALAQSRGSTAWFRERPDYSNVVFTFMNRAAEALSRTHPDKYLGALAYYWCENVPDFPLHPQVIPFLTADRSQGYDPAFRAEEFRLQERWGELAGGGRGNADKFGPRRLGMYDYLYGGGFLIPRIHTRLLAENLRHARRSGFTDYYAEVNPNWGLDGPMPWLTSQLLQNPEQSREALLDDYYDRYFQEAAEPMRRFFEKCEELWMAQPKPSYWLKHYRNESQAVIFPPAARGFLRLLMSEGELLARSALVRDRVRLLSEAFGVTERFAELKETRDHVLRIALSQTAADRRVLSDALAAHLDARRDFIRYTVQLRHRQPLALHPFIWDDYLKNDPLPLALAALCRGAPQTSTTDQRERRDSGEQRVAVEEGSPAPAVRRKDRFVLPAALERESLVAPLWLAFSRSEAAGDGSRNRSGTELLANPGMEGEPKPARSIAGLPYSVALPAPWISQVEPAQFHQAELVNTSALAAGANQSFDAGRGVLRVSGSKDTMVSQWVLTRGSSAAQSQSGVKSDGSPGEARVHVARMSLRGRVSPSTAVSLILSWLDANHRHVGFKSVRLPDGEWPEFVTLLQAGLVPPDAVWTGVGIRVQNQVKGDWVEAAGFSLQALQ